MTSNGHTSFIVGMPIEDVDDSEAFISVDQLRHLVRLIDHSDIAELEVKQQGPQKARILLRKVKPLESDLAQPETPPLAEEAACSAEHTHYTITAPFVGFFQPWSKSKDKPLVSAGDSIKAGQHVGVIRSLDIPNEVEAAVTGRVVELLVQDGQAVEYGQPLMTIDQH